MSTVDDVTDSQWETTVLQSQTPVLVDFWADWCAPCRAMSPLVDRLATELGDKIKVLKINTSDNNEIPAKYGITSIPTFLILKDGEVAEQLVGVQSFDKFKAAVEKHV